jgi:hypothetical protein
VLLDICPDVDETALGALRLAKIRNCADQLCWHRRLAPLAPMVTRTVRISSHADERAACSQSSEKHSKRQISLVMVIIWPI